ncbi:MAG: NPCBM/NEW2 domain-containing protein, partial [Limisphaerales bacterium]
MNLQLVIFRLAVGILAVAVMAHTTQALEIKPTSKELRAEEAWLKEHLLECKLKPSTAQSAEAVSPPKEPGLDVLANNDSVIQNGRGSKPMKIGDKEYSRGLYCHAVSKVDVSLPGPGKIFTAVVGLDHNEDTPRGKGSVVFTVKVRDKVAFQSGVMRIGTPGREVSVDLGGALGDGAWMTCMERNSDIVLLSCYAPL